MQGTKMKDQEKNQVLQHHKKSPKRSRRKAPPTDDGSSSEEEDFAALRRNAKTGPTAPKKRDKPKVVVPDRSSDDFSIASAGVFSCDAGEKALRAAKEAAKKQAACSDDADLDDLILFFEMQGLQGPLRAYAKAFVAQGIRDATLFTVIPEDGMRKMVQRADLDPGDELLLTEALMNLR